MAIKITNFKNKFESKKDIRYNDEYVEFILNVEDRK
jgi:hypothetical protein